MGKPGPKPLGKAKTEWSPNFAYALGLLATDGCLSRDGRHIDLTSKNLEQLENFMKCLGIKVKIGYKTSGYTDKKYTRIQFSDSNLYQVLLGIGFTPAKTKTIAVLKIPERYFFDFLRGHLDGDGSFHAYWDPRWHSSFMFYTTFTSASKAHIDWIRATLGNILEIKGAIDNTPRKSVYQLKYAKTESLKLIPRLYYHSGVVCLSRKRKKIEEILKVNREHNRNARVS